MQIVILLGAPGCGKGTMAGRLSASNTSFRTVSSGDLLRDAVKRQTPSGVLADGFMKRGELVPDALIAQMITDYMLGIPSDCTLLLDGFPRTVVQAEMLDKIIVANRATLSAVILMEVPDSILIDRIAGRRGCPKCGAGYHVLSIPSKIAGICDICGTALVIRKDDNPETVKNRLAVYQSQTMPLIAFYEGRGLLKRIAAHGIPINDIFENIRHVLS
ncbi:MAG: adenylate kinase [bacterium]